METCSSYRCAVRQQKCTAALVKAECIPLCSVLLCKTGSQQVCVTAITPMEICSSYRLCNEPIEIHCSTGQGKMHSPLFSAVLQNRLTAGLCHCNNTYGDWHFIQVSSESTEMDCSTGQGKMPSPLFSAALQNRLTAGLCHCNHTYGDWHFIQVSSESTEMDCSTGQGKMHSPQFSAALQNRLTAGLCRCNHTYGDLLFIQVCSEPISMAVQHWSRQNAFPYGQCCSAKQAHSMLVSLQLHLWRLALHTGVQ